MNIVIAEDEKIITKWLKKKITGLSDDYNIVHICENGADARNVCLTKNVDILFTDIRMPEMDGIQLIESLAKLQALPFTVVLSAFGDYKYVKQAFLYGANDYLLKTEVTREDLQTVLQKAEAAMSRKENAEESEVTDIRGWGEKFICANNCTYRMLLIDGGINRIDAETMKDMRAVLSDENDQRSDFFCCEDSMSYMLLTEEKMREENSLTEIVNYFRSFGWKETLVLASGRGSKLNDLQRCIQDVINLRGAAKFYGRCGAFLLDEVIRRQEENREAFISLQKTIMRNAEDEKEVNKFFDLSKKYMCDVTEVKSTLLNAFAKLKIGREILEREESEVSPFFLQLDKAASAKELEEVYRSALRDLKSRIANNRNMYSEPICLALDYIHAHYDEEIDLDTLADTVHLNRSYLSTRFKQEVGQNLRNYLLEYRLDMAKERLAKTEDSIKEICIAVGIPDNAYFSKQFKIYTGGTPFNYRASTRA